MGAFMAHPVGAQAWVYSVYWLIPVLLYVIRKKSLFLEALGSTFIAHAVGSVIWIYADPITPHAWLALIPVVFIERLIFASGIVVVFHCIQQANKIWQQTNIVFRLRRYFIA